MNYFTFQNFVIPFITIATLHFLAVISPGPDFAMVVKTAISQPRKIAIYNAFGIALGILVHITYCILGLALVITKSIILFSIFKYLAAAYFIYLGIQGLLAKKSTSKNTDVMPTEKVISIATAIKRGFFCNALNPKATMFFLGLFTLVVKPDTPVVIEVIYGLEMFIATFLWFTFLAIVITHANIKKKMVRFQYYITKCMSGLLIAFGIKLALMEFK